MYYEFIHSINNRAQPAQVLQYKQKLMLLKFIEIKLLLVNGLP
jgi:hypothetical protein